MRNSGIAGGKFLERQKVYKPSSDDEYTYIDRYVGATLEVSSSASLDVGAAQMSGLQLPGSSAKPERFAVCADETCAREQIFNRTFELVEADEYTYTYMENNKHVFIMADAEILHKSLKAQSAGKDDAIRTSLIEVRRGGGEGKRGGLLGSGGRAKARAHLLELSMLTWGCARALVRRRTRRAAACSTRTSSKRR